MSHAFMYYSCLLQIFPRVEPDCRIVQPPLPRAQQRNQHPLLLLLQQTVQVVMHVVHLSICEYELEIVPRVEARRAFRQCLGKKDPPPQSR